MGSWSGMLPSITDEFRDAIAWYLEDHLSYSAMSYPARQSTGGGHISLFKGDTLVATIYLEDGLVCYRTIGVDLDIKDGAISVNDPNLLATLVAALRQV
jgi:hypothetical protein